MRILLSCKECGVKADNPRARFCWSCGAELPNSCLNPRCGAAVDPCAVNCPLCGGLTERGRKEMSVQTKEILHRTAELMAAGSGAEPLHRYAEEQAAQLRRFLTGKNGG